MNFCILFEPVMLEEPDERRKCKLEKAFCALAKKVSVIIFMLYDNNYIEVRTLPTLYQLVELGIISQEGRNIGWLMLATTK